MSRIYFIVLLCSLASAQRRSVPSNLGAGLSGDNLGSAGLRGLGHLQSGLSSASGLRGSLDGLHPVHLASASDQAGGRSDLTNFRGLYGSSGLVRGHDHALGSVAGLNPVSGYHSDGSAGNRYSSAAGAGDQNRLSGHGLRGYGAQAYAREVNDLEELKGYVGDLTSLAYLSNRASAGHHLKEQGLAGQNLHEHDLRLEDDLLAGSEASSRRPRLRPLISYHNAPRSRPLNYNRPSRLGPRHQRPVFYKSEDSAYGSHGLGDSAGGAYGNLGDSGLSYRGQGVDSDAVSALGGATDSYNLHAGSVSSRADSGLSELHSGVAVQDASSQRAESDSARGLASSYGLGDGVGSSAELVGGSSGLSHSGLVGLNVD